MENKTGGEIIIYKDKTGKKAVDVRLEKDTIWANLNQIAKLFDRDKSVISRHIKSIFKEKELDKISVVAKIATTAADGKTYQVEYYNLDMIISVGYRVNSKQATKFRIWATSILKDYLVKGYVINRQRIGRHFQEFEKDLNSIRRLLPAAGNIDNKSIIELVKTFADTWLSLSAYDKNELKIGKVSRRKVKLTAGELKAAIDDFKAELLKKKAATEIFAQERQAGSIEGIVGNVMQGFGGKDVYPSLEEKAAHLLYFMVKNHPFVDGNKRSGAYSFVWFLKRVRLLNLKHLTPAALTAITLLIAESRPGDKDKMTALTVRLIKK